MEVEAVWLEQNRAMRQAIIDGIAPETIELWSRKNNDYAGQQMFLGLRAQFCDINRKFWKLKQSLWDGRELDYESPREICQDMIGHLLMTIYFIDQAEKKKGIGGEDVPDGRA